MAASSWKEGVGELCCLACEDRAGGSPGGLPTLSQVPADLLAVPRAAPVPAAQARGALWQGGCGGALVVGGMLVSPPNREQSPAMVTSPLCVCTLHLFLLQVWQHDKQKGLSPAACGKAPHVVGVAPVSQQDVDRTSSMCLSASLQWQQHILSQ